jgi:glucokinase
MESDKYILRERWFKDRVGKVVFRTRDSCHCAVCNDVYKNGIQITNQSHALSLHDCEMELNLRYFDTKEERDEYEKKIQLEIK